MHKLDLPVDLKEAAAIQARRIREEARKERIFNPRNRIIGVDKEALTQQIEERKRREERERLRDLAYDKNAIRNDRISVILQQRDKIEREELLKRLNEFRERHQKPETRREFDLYDPQRIKKDLPARVSDDDPRCGPASLQKFEGEDLNDKARQEHQMKQKKDWYDRQISEKRLAERANREAERLYELKQCELDQRACELAAAEKDCRRAILEATRRYNEALANERATKERQKKKIETEDNITEIHNSLFSDLLTENPSQAISAFGPHRVVTDRFKGMRADQLDNILRIRKEQCEDNERIRQEKEREEREFDRQLVQSAKLGHMLDCKQKLDMKDYQRRLAEENIRLASAQAANKKYLNEEGGKSYCGSGIN